MATQISCQSDEDGRRTLRTSLSRSAILTMATGKSVKVTIRDVSEGGFRFKLRWHIVEESDAVWVQLISGLMRMARVVWVRGHDVGCEWFDPDCIVADAG